MFGAKLSWCQIVRCQIVLVPNCPGAKLSVFIILVPNCPVLNCPVPNWLIIVTRTILRCFEDSVSYSMTGYLLKCPGQRKSAQSLRRVGGQFEKHWMELIFCSSQPSMVHWLSSPIFPCSFVRSVVPLW